MSLLHQWWVWAIAGLALAILEMVLPSYLFLGFGIGAGIVALVLLNASINGAAALGIPALILLFAVCSLVAWYGLRRIFGLRKGQVKVWDRDINDN